MDSRQSDLQTTLTINETLTTNGEHTMGRNRKGEPNKANEIRAALNHLGEDAENSQIVEYLRKLNIHVDSIYVSQIRHMMKRQAGKNTVSIDDLNWRM